MIDIKVVLVVSLVLVSSADDTRNSHAPCEILINEVSTKVPAFAEVAKFCPSTKNPNVQQTLGGYNLIIVEAPDLTVVYRKSLERLKLKTKPWNPPASKEATATSSAPSGGTLRSEVGNQGPQKAATTNSQSLKAATIELRQDKTHDKRKAESNQVPGVTEAAFTNPAEANARQNSRSVSQTSVKQTGQPEQRVAESSASSQTGARDLPALATQSSQTEAQASPAPVIQSSQTRLEALPAPVIHTPVSYSDDIGKLKSTQSQPGLQGQAVINHCGDTGRTVTSYTRAKETDSDKPAITYGSVPLQKTTANFPSPHHHSGSLPGSQQPSPAIASNEPPIVLQGQHEATMTNPSLKPAGHKLPKDSTTVSTAPPSSKGPQPSGHPSVGAATLSSNGKASTAGTCREPCPTPTKRSRQKRSLNEEQQNLWGIFDVELTNINFEPHKSYAVLLVYVPSKMRTALWDKFKVGEALREEVQAELQRYTHDALLLASTEPDSDHSKLLKILPPGTDLIFVDPPDAQGDDNSISKCDALITPFNPDGFTHSPRSRGLPNTCPPPPKFNPFSFRRKVVRKQSQEFIVNAVLGLKEKLQNQDWRNLSAEDAAAAILNLSSDTVRRVLSKFYAGRPFDDGKKRCRQRPTTDLTHVERKILYDILKGFYAKNRVPRFAAVLQEFVAKVREARLRELESAPREQPPVSREKQSVYGNPLAEEEIEEDWDAERPAPEVYHCSAKSFSKILDKCGYKYGKIKNRDSQIFRPSNIEWRTLYLDAIAKYDADPEWTVIYQDETWIDPHQRADRGWVLKRFMNFEQRKDFTFRDSKISRGTRLIILAAGGKDGFIQEATKIFAVPVNSKKSKGCNEGASSCAETVSEDYHDNVKGPFFLQWLETLFQILKDKQKKAVIVMDNCPYHKVLAVPKTSDKKDDVRTWLETKKSEGLDIPEDVTADTKLTKVQLLAIVKRLTDGQFGDQRVPRTKIQQLADKYGHRVLLTPPYNCDLNPIEYVWSDIKREVKEKNTEQAVAHALMLAEHEMRTYTKDKWMKHIGHVKGLEKDYREGDKVFTQNNNNDPEEESVETLTEADLEIIDRELGVADADFCEED